MRIIILVNQISSEVYIQWILTQSLAEMMGMWPSDTTVKFWWRSAFFSCFLDHLQKFLNISKLTFCSLFQRFINGFNSMFFKQVRRDTETNGLDVCGNPLRVRQSLVV